jgi:hypothetical protein
LVGETLDALGELYRMRGMWAEAVQTHEEALAIWRELAGMGEGLDHGGAKPHEEHGARSHEA